MPQNTNELAETIRHVITNIPQQQAVCWPSDWTPRSIVEMGVHPMPYVPLEMCWSSIRHHSKPEMVEKDGQNIINDPINRKETIR